jgi:hypothetical protein
MGHDSMTPQERRHIKNKTFHIIYYIHYTKACTHGGNKKCKQNFGWKNLKGRDHSEDLNVDGRILEWILKNYVGRV